MAATNPPQVGVTVDRASLNAKLGGNSSSLRKATTGLDELAQWAAAYTGQQLVDLYGFTAEEATLFKSACGEVSQLTAVVDGFAFISRTWGA